MPKRELNANIQGRLVQALSQGGELHSIMKREDETVLGLQDPPTLKKTLLLQANRSS